MVWCEEPLPHDIHNARAIAIAGVASAGNHLRPRANKSAKPDNIKAVNIALGGNAMRCPAPVVVEAVVPTLTVTVWLEAALICTEEFDRLHVGAGVTTGVIAQLRFTVPLKELIAPNASLKLALCPALMVWEVGEPDAGPMVKSGVVVFSMTPTPLKV